MTKTYRFDIIDNHGRLTEDDGLTIATIATVRVPAGSTGGQINAWLAAKGYRACGETRIVGSRTRRTIVRPV